MSANSLIFFSKAEQSNDLRVGSLAHAYRNKHIWTKLMTESLVVLCVSSTEVNHTIGTNKVATAATAINTRIGTLIFAMLHLSTDVSNTLRAQIYSQLRIEL